MAIISRRQNVQNIIITSSVLISGGSIIPNQRNAFKCFCHAYRTVCHGDQIGTLVGKGVALLLLQFIANVVNF